MEQCRATPAEDSLLTVAKLATTDGDSKKFTSAPDSNTPVSAGGNKCGNTTQRNSRQPITRPPTEPQVKQVPPDPNLNQPQTPSNSNEDTSGNEPPRHTRERQDEYRQGKYNPNAKQRLPQRPWGDEGRLEVSTDPRMGRPRSRVPHRQQ